MERWKKIAVIIQGFTAVGVVFAGVGLWLQWQAIKNETFWNRAEKTQKVLDEFNEKVIDYSDTLREEIPHHFDKTDPRTLTPQRIDQLLESQAPEDVASRRDLIAFLNYMTSLCVLYDLEIVDKATFETELGYFLVSTYDELRPFHKKSQIRDSGREIEDVKDRVIPQLRRALAKEELVEQESASQFQSAAEDPFESLVGPETAFAVFFIFTAAVAVAVLLRV